MGSRNRSPRCRNRHANFTFRLSLFRPSVLYTDQRYKSGTKSSRFERGESSFRCWGLRNPSSPRISHLHLSVSNARFWIGHVHSTPCLYVCTCACGARTYSVCIKRAKDRARAPGACVITVRVRSKVESAEDRLLAFAFHKPLPTMLYNVPLFEWHFAWDPSFCGFAGERGEGLGGWISRKLSSELRIMSGCRAQEMTELSGRGHGTRIFVKTKLILYRVRYGHVCT